MILGYILICGMGITQPNAVDGCLQTTRLFPSMELCEGGRQLYLDYSILQEGHYIGGSGCFMVGTNVLIRRNGKTD